MPQTVYDVGDPITSRLKLGVTPDGTTNVTVVVTKPDGSAQTVTGPTGPVNVDEWTARWTADYTDGGDYVAVWTVTGTGAGAQSKVYNVRPHPTARTRPLWAPFLSDVADHCPWLTVDVITPGSALHYGTFTGNTWPTDEQAQRLTDQAVTSVSAAVGTLATALYPMAKLVASLRAAAAIIRAYPRDTNDLNTADALDRRADSELARLVTANTDAGQQPVPATVMPLYAFPEPVGWGDDYL